MILMVIWVTNMVIKILSIGHLKTKQVVIFSVIELYKPEPDHKDVNWFWDTIFI